MGATPPGLGNLCLSFHRAQGTRRSGQIGELDAAQPVEVVAASSSTRSERLRAKTKMRRHREARDKALLRRSPPRWIKPRTSWSWSITAPRTVMLKSLPVSADRILVREERDFSVATESRHTQQGWRLFHPPYPFLRLPCAAGRKKKEARRPLLNAAVKRRTAPTAGQWNCDAQPAELRAPGR